jgi:hypothetical protein
MSYSACAQRPSADTSARGIEDFEPMQGFGDYTFEFESTEVETLKYAVQDSPYCRAHE